MLLIVLTVQAAAGNAAFPLAAPVLELLLVEGKSVEGKLSGDEVHSYHLDFPDRIFLRVDVYSPNIDLYVSIDKPNGKRLSEWNVLKRTFVPIAAIPDIPGSYLLKVRRSGKNSDPGFYKMVIESLRKENDNDQKLADACSHLSDAAQRRRQWTEPSLRSAIGEYEAALRIWRELGDLEQEASTLKSTGDVWEILAEWDTTRSFYEKAQAVLSRQNSPLLKTEIINATSALYINQGQYEKALELYTPAYTETEDLWLKAQILRNFGAAYWGLAAMPKARDFLNRALELWKRLQDREGQADVLMYLGYVNHAMKDISTAEQYYQESLDLYKEAENPRGIALVMTSMGDLSNVTGDRKQALEYFDRSLKIFETIGELSGRYIVLKGKALLYSNLGDNGTALQYYLDALELVQRADDRVIEGEILDRIGVIYRVLHDYDNALQYSQKAVRINNSLHTDLGEAYARLNLAKILEALEKREEAIETCLQAFELSKKGGGDKFLEGQLLDTLGHLHHESGQPERALNYYQQALSIQEEAGDSVGISGTLHNIARAERDIGNPAQAMRYSDRSLQEIESLRDKVIGPELRESYLALVYRQYEFHIDLLMQLHKQQPLERFDAEAFKISEQARARSLLDMLGETSTDIREGVDLELLQRERSLQKELNSKAALQMQSLNREDSGEEEEALDKKIEEITAEYQYVKALIRINSPRYAALTQPQPLNLQAIQQLLDEDTLLLEYTLGENSSYLWAVTFDNFQSHRLPNREDIEKRIHTVRRSILERQRYVEETTAEYRQRIGDADTVLRRETAALSRMLLGPVSDRLASKRLLVVAEGAMQYLPFGMLPKPETSAKDAAENPELMISGHEIVSLPSASVLKLLRQELGARLTPPKTLAVLADPVFEANDPRFEAGSFSKKSETEAPAASGTGRVNDPRRGVRQIELSGEGFSLDRLLGSREEANSIIALVPGEMGLKLLDFDANRKVVSGSELGQYKIVHFATHGFIDEGRPELSGLALSRYDRLGRSQEGYLRLHDIYNLHLPVDLVVLSACNSALGEEVRGEGLVGIVRGFMYAGAGRVLASLWKVDDEATAALMEKFYRHLLFENRTPADALRLAQLDISGQLRWHAPYYWAAFILQGEYR